MTTEAKTDSAPNGASDHAGAVDITSDAVTDAVRAQSMLRPTVQAALTLRGYGKRFGELSVLGLVNELGKQCEQAVGGNLSRAEAMLITQAHTLDVIFNTLAARAERQEHLPQFESALRMALKAQNQCRTTLETLAEIKNPRPVAFVKQANIATNQQVNNGAAANVPRAENSETRSNELLAVTHAPGERLDFRATEATGGEDASQPAMATVDRTADTGR